MKILKKTLSLLFAFAILMTIVFINLYLNKISFNPISEDAQKNSFLILFAILFIVFLLKDFRKHISLYNKQRRSLSERRLSSMIYVGKAWVISSLLSIIIFSVFIGLFKLFISFTTGCDNNVGSRKQEAITLVHKEIKEETPSLDLNCQYPEFENGPEELNEQIKKYIDDNVTSAREGAKEIYQEYQDEIASDPDPYLIRCNDGGSSLEIDYKIIQLNKEYISLRFFSIFCCSGAAHPATEWKSFNYDLKKKKFFTLREFFNDDSSFLFKLCDLCKKEVRKAGNSSYTDEFERDGTIMGWDTIDSGWKKFEAFTLTDDVINLYFDWGAWHGVEFVLLRKDII